MGRSVVVDDSTRLGATLVLRRDAVQVKLCVAAGQGVGSAGGTERVYEYGCTSTDVCMYVYRWMRKAAAAAGDERTCVCLSLGVCQSVCLSACLCLLSLVLVLSSRSMSDPPLEDQAV